MSGFLTLLFGSLIRPFTLQTSKDSVCGCDFSVCFEEKVFADSEGTGDFWKADKSDFLFKKVVAADAVVFEIIRNGVKVADGSNALGTLYSSFTNAPLYAGYLANWTAIFAAFGGGLYNIVISYTSFSTNYKIKSRDFRLYPYNAELANRTVKIESFQKGNIIGSEFDYSLVLADLPNGWYSSLRLTGTFGNRTPTLESDDYLNTFYKQVQNRTQIINEFTLETELIPNTILKQIANQNVLANEVFVTNYDLEADELFRNFAVVPKSFSEVNHLNRSSVKFAITFQERTQNIIKRNF